MQEALNQKIDAYIAENKEQLLQDIARLQDALGQYEQLDKQRAQAKAAREARGAHYLLEVDGGVDNATAPQCVEAGADILVAGSAVFGAADPAAAVQHLASL